MKRISLLRGQWVSTGTFGLHREEVEVFDVIFTGLGGCAGRLAVNGNVRGHQWNQTASRFLMTVRQAARYRRHCRPWHQLWFDGALK
jgi:hypothetical protein